MVRRAGGLPGQNLEVKVPQPKSALAVIGERIETRQAMRADLLIGIHGQLGKIERKTHDAARSVNGVMQIKIKELLSDARQLERMQNKVAGYTAKIAELSATRNAIKEEQNK